MNLNEQSKASSLKSWNKLIFLSFLLDLTTSFSITAKSEWRMRNPSLWQTSQKWNTTNHLNKTSVLHKKKLFGKIFKLPENSWTRSETHQFLFFTAVNWISTTIQGRVFFLMDCTVLCCRSLSAVGASVDLTCNTASYWPASWTNVLHHTETSVIQIRCLPSL